MIVVTSQRNQYKIDLPEMKNKTAIEERDKFNVSLFSLKYPVNTSNFSQRLSPILIGQELKYIVAGDDTGVVTVWKDSEQLEHNCGTLLRGHSSKISSIKVTKNQDYLFTLGQDDNSIFEWKIDLVSESSAETKLIRKAAESHSTEASIPDIIRRELDFCTSFAPNSNRSRDSFSLFRGTTNKLLNTLYSHTLEPFDENSLLNKRIPEVSIRLDRVYGFEAYERRNTLAYISLGSSEVWEPEKLGLYSYDQITSTSPNNKNFVYFVSRVAVVAHSGTKRQRFYEGHSNKISCMAVHPSKQMVATGECAESPQIHVWRADEDVCSPEAVVRTNHGTGIVNLAFSHCGELLVSVGIDKYFSLQVTDWGLEEVVAFRNTSPGPITDLVVNPYDKYEFATCGNHIVQVWGVQGKTIVLKENVHVTIGVKNELPYITCVKYIYYMLQGEVQTDIVVGTNQGDLGLVCKGKYLVARETAHKKMINCIRITDVFRKVVMVSTQQLIIITAGEDEFIKFFDSSFQIKHELNLRAYEMNKMIQGKVVPVEPVHQCSESRHLRLVQGPR